MIRVPALHLNNHQSYAGHDYNEIWISVGDYRLIVDNYFVWQLPEKCKHIPLAGGGAAGKAIWYHFRQDCPSSKRLPSSSMKLHRSPALAKEDSCSYGILPTFEINAKSPAAAES
jgi:hypothetical protein